MQKKRSILISTVLPVIIILHWAIANNLISWVNIDGTIAIYVNWKVLILKLHETYVLGLVINRVTPNQRS